MALMVTVERLGQAAETFFLLDNSGNILLAQNDDMLEFEPQTPST